MGNGWNAPSPGSTSRISAAGGLVNGVCVFDHSEVRSGWIRIDELVSSGTVSSIKWLSLLVTKCTVFDDVISRRHDVIYNCHVTPRAQIRYRPSIGLIFKSRDFKGDVIQPYLGIWHQKIFIDFIFKNKTVKQGKWYLKYLRYYWPW